MRGLKLIYQVIEILLQIVAPFAGAWIEICTPHGVSLGVQSHPSRVRGLKYRQYKHQEKSRKVAPFAGAWIEIRKWSTRQSLKLLSHPSRVRGLKYCLPSVVQTLSRVAPFAGAWIEILMEFHKVFTWLVAPFAGAWIEIKIG